ncbi:MAG: hypothetical protein CMJ85_14765 [Planctomycetes bacterium]|jgi:hypothetical protein|nr:hypothetical protein [Planctomycetota bacterium]
MTENTDELHELESLEEVAPPPAQAQFDYQEGLFQRSMAGMPAPAFNPSTSKEYYSFLFCGVLIVLGCLMPFDHDFSHTGYKTFFGGLWMLIGVGLIWSTWGAINTGLFRMKWVLLCFFPLAWGLIYLIFYAKFQAPNMALPIDTELLKDLTGDVLEAKRKALAAEADPNVNNWSELFAKLLDRKDTERFSKVGQALQHVGPGKLFVFFGSFLAGLYFILGIFGGVRRMKEQKAQRIAAARR